MTWTNIEQNSHDTKKLLPKKESNGFCHNFINHENKRNKSDYTLEWNNIGDHLFDLQNELPWTQVSEALSNIWRQNCGRSLTEEDNYYLACKAFQDNEIDPNDLINRTLSLAQFNQDKLPNSCHTFWEWFDSMMVLTKQYLASVWKKGYVIGFISRLDANSLLEDSPEGTFLLRFSDSVLGGVTIGYKPEMSSKQSVRWLAPFTKEILEMRGIVDLISDLTYLKTLYPNIPKTCFKEKQRHLSWNYDGA